jgi:hypothetical protein
VCRKFETATGSTVALMGDVARHNAEADTDSRQVKVERSLGGRVL